jgi:eukaryotic-like serine/threonine-protein kinase
LRKRTATGIFAMPEPHATEHSEDERLDAIICEYLEAAERGEPPAQEAFVARHPEYASELREFFSDWQGMPELSGSSLSGDTFRTARDESDVVRNADLLAMELDDFELVREIGRGGMGLVFEARQRSLRRNVAVKSMSFGKTSARHARPGRKAAERNIDEMRGRFLREAEVTGGLQHPGIVPVYAVGAAADGQPFYAMRLIEGESLHDAIVDFHAQLALNEDFPRTRAFEFRRLLRRLIDVCNAVDYAHSQQVIHRDIKPRNVMLGRFGETLVVDWGLAKVASPTTGWADTAPLPLSQPASGTHQGSAVGTPAFMSPEQAAGDLERLGPASDVYSLGATLYCLLAGKTAFEGRDLLATFERVKRGEFPRPREVRAEIPAALEAICLRGMALAKSDRYPTATALADDVERWLADEPVSAYQEPFLERCARWGRRHRTWIRAAAVVLVLVSLVATIGALLVNDARQTAEAHRQQALERLAQARRATDQWIVAASDALQTFPDAQSTRKELLTQVAKDYESFVGQASDDPVIELDRGRVLLRLGDVRRLLGDSAEAGRSYAEASAHFEQVLSRDPKWRDARFEAANAQLRQGLASGDQKEFAEADRHYLASLELSDGLLAEAPSNDEYREGWSAAIVDRAALLANQGKWAESRELLDTAMARTAEWQETSPDSPTLHHIRAQLARLLSDVHLAQNRHREALTALTKAVESLDRLVEFDSENTALTNDRAGAQVQLAVLARSLGLTEQERRAYQSARGDFQRLHERFPDIPGHQESLALTEVDLAQVELQINEADIAAARAASAIAEYDELTALSEELRYREGLAAAQDVRGQAQLDLGAADDAKDAFAAAIANLAPLAETYQDEPAYRHRLAVTQSHLAQALTVLGGEENLAEAERLFATSDDELTQLAEGEEATPEFTYTAALAAQQCGERLLQAGQSDAGKSALRTAAKHWNNLVALGPMSPEYRDRYARFLAECSESSIQNPAQALELAQQASSAAPENAEFLTTLGSLQVRLGDRAQGIADLRRAIALRPSARTHLYLAHAHLADNATAAREQFALGDAWLQQHAAGNLELQRLRDKVAAELATLPAD